MKSENPYQSPRSVEQEEERTTPAKDAQRTRPALLLPVLIGVAVPACLPPIPLLGWVMDGEPFIGPPSKEELRKLLLAGTMGVLWGGWSCLLVVAIVKQWLHPATSLWLFFGLFFCAISILVLYLYSLG